MQFSRGRMAKLAGLLKEGVDEADDEVPVVLTESAGATEAECDEGVYEIDEKEMKELEESFDLRKAIRDEVKRSLEARDAETVRYTSGRVFGGKHAKSYEGITMGFPGIGFRR